MRCIGLIVVIVTFLAAVGCVTSDSTSRQIDRQLELLGAAHKVYAATQDALIEVGEKIEQGELDLKALQAQRAVEIIEENAVPADEAP